MPAPKPLKNATDAHVTQQRPRINQAGTNRLWVSAVSGNTRFAYIYFTLPYPKGSTVLNGKLRVRNAKDIDGSVTLTVSRVTEPWNPSRVNYNNRPAVTGTNAVSVTKNNPRKNAVWEFDVMPMLQSMTRSDRWWGFRISTSFNSGGVVLFSCNANEDARPELEIEWTDAPEAPDELSPSGGRAIGINQPTLEFNFQDDAGDTELNACRVQFASSKAGWTEDAGFPAPSWDSGTEFVSEPELNLATLSGAPVLASDVVTWWTVQVQDGAGKWSKWSEPTSFKYLAPPTVTLNSPGLSPNNYVEDSTPPIDWTVTGGTQTAYKVIVVDPDEPSEQLYNSGKITSTDTDITLPKKVIRWSNKNYRVILRVWDDAPREKNAASKIYTEIVRDFEFRPTDSVEKVSSVIAQQATPWPWVNVRFSRNIMPDQFNIYRDDELIEANIEAPDIFDSGSSYTYVDRMASPRESHTWSVEAVVNSQASKKVNSNVVQTRLIAPVMMELDASNPIYFMNPAASPQQAMFQEAHQPVRGPKVLITQYQGGYEGRLEGQLVDGILPGVTARNMRQRFKKWKKNPGSAYYLYLVDEVMKVVPYNMVYVPKAYSGGVKYLVSFDFFEVD